jgi:hypothetical protein
VGYLGRGGEYSLVGDILVGKMAEMEKKGK